MGYMLLLARCFCCHSTFTCNPETVPSYENQPICEACITLVNEKRREGGLPEWPVFPNSYGMAEA